MLKKLLGHTESSATIGAGQKLVLSLDNALTPAMWVIDLNESPSILFKVTETDDGLFVLQKLIEGTKGRTSEDLAYYSKKMQAVDAMQKASKALAKNQNNNETGLFMRIVRTFVNITAVLVLILFISIYFRLDVMLVNFLTNDAPQQISAPQETNTQSSIQPSSNPSDVGVPLSADDFFNNQGSGRSSGLPF